LGGNILRLDERGTQEKSSADRYETAEEARATLGYACDVQHVVMLAGVFERVCIQMTIESDRAMRVAFFTLGLLTAVNAAQPPTQVPTFEVDAKWPKPLPNRWILGAVAGVHVDANDHIWIVHRPSTLQPNETRSIWRAAPPVLEFDQAGNLLSSWGGTGEGYE